MHFKPTIYFNRPRNFSPHLWKIVAVTVGILLFNLSNKVLLAQITKPNAVQIEKAKQVKNEEQLAINYYRNRQFEKAAALFKPLFDQKKSQYHYMYYLNCLLELQQYKEAERIVKKQRKNHPKNYRYLIDQAYVYDQLGEEKKSNKLFSKLMSKLPTDRNSIIQIASALQTRGYNELAVLTYKKSRNNPEVSYTFNMEIANVYMYSGDYTRVFDSYISQLEENPKDMQTIKNRLQNILRMDVDNNLSDVFRKKLLEKAQKNADNEILADMLLWYSIQIKDFPLALRQAKAIDKRFGFREEEVMELADIAFQNKQFEISMDAFAYIKNKKDNSPYYLEASTGYYKSHVNLANTNPSTQVDTYKKLIKEGEKSLKELGLNNQTIEIARLQAHLEAFEFQNFQNATLLLNQAIEVPSLNKEKSATLKLELADILLASGKIWDATLLYSEVESDMKNEAIGHEAKLKNAKVFYYVGEFSWAQTKLDILKSATSKLISNDAIDLSLFISDILEEDTLGFTLRRFAAADMYSYQHHFDSALVMLNKIENLNPGYIALPYVWYKKAKLYTDQHQFIEADSIYNQLVTNYPENVKADNALYLQAELRRLSLNDPSGALDRYMKLMTDYPESLFSGEARIKYRALREVTSE